MTKHPSQLLSASEAALQTVVAKVWSYLVLAFCNYLENELTVITSLAEDSLIHFVYD